MSSLFATWQPESAKPTTLPRRGGRLRSVCSFSSLVAGVIVLVAAGAQDERKPDPAESEGHKAQAATGQAATGQAATGQAATGQAATGQAATGQAATGQAATARGRLIRVPLPITGNLDDRIKQIIRSAAVQIKPEGRQDGTGRPVLVLELSPGATEFGRGSRFGRARALAKFLSSRELAGIKTVAYIPRSIKGHAVLVAMACEEIVMAPDAEIGEAGIDEPEAFPIQPDIRSLYEQVANDRRTIPAEVALGLLSKELEVLKVETEVTVEFVLRQDLEALKARRAIQSTDVIIRAGEAGRFTGREGREFGFVKYLASDRESVARALRLPANSLHEDPSLDGGWQPIQIRVEGPIHARLVGRLQSMIDDQMRIGDVNFVCLRIDSSGGSLEDSMVLANYLAGLDAGFVRTVAYVPGEARADAALIAEACDQVVMHPKAILGGPGPDPIDENGVMAARETIRKSLAPKKSRSWSPVAALIDPSLEVYRYRHQESGSERFFSELEAAEQKEPEKWLQGERVTTEGSPLELEGQRARELGLAWNVVESFADLKDLYGLQEDPRLAEPSWADFLVEALATPGVAALLLVLGGIGVYAELQAPGIGIGGFLAGVAFLLFFWSKFLYGTAGWLEVILFMGGFCCLLLEIFVIPGFGVFGLGGGLMIITSLVLASQTFVFPRTSSELSELRSSLLVVGGAGVGIVSGAFLLRRFLPHTPLFGRLMLNPLQDQELAELTDRESGVDFDHLLGEEGTATTPLMPSGKARFGHDFLDVIANGEVIDQGTQVVVVEVRGNRVLVQAVS